MAGISASARPRLTAVRTIVLGLTAVLVAGLAVPQSASAAGTARPAQVGLVTFTGAGLTSAGASLTLDWPDVKGATGYQVFASTSYDGVYDLTTPSATSTKSAATVTGLKKGADYFVTVKAVNSAGGGPRSSRYGHGTIVAEAPASSAPTTRLMSWNICSNACSGIASRAGVINRRIGDYKPGVVALQEASRYTKAPSGYSFAVNGQNDILVRKGEYSVVKGDRRAATSGYVKFSAKYASGGKGIAWAVVRHKSGANLVVFNTHFTAGTSKAQVAQREYEATRLPAFMSSTLRTLAAAYGAKWTSAPTVVIGDLNTHTSRTERTQGLLEKAGWYDAFDQARSLTGQHFNTANPLMKSSPVLGLTWGDHVDKVLVRPSKSIVLTWANAGKMSGGKFVTPLGSDHHPLIVRAVLR